MWITNFHKVTKFFDFKWNRKFNLLYALSASSNTFLSWHSRSIFCIHSLLEMFKNLPNFCYTGNVKFDDIWRYLIWFDKPFFLTQVALKCKNLMKISKVIFHIKQIPSHLWWKCKKLPIHANELNAIINIVLQWF